MRDGSDRRDRRDGRDRRDMRDRKDRNDRRERWVRLKQAEVRRNPWRVEHKSARENRRK
jgi:hypothetical protein